MNNQTSSLEFSHFPVMLNEVLKISTPSREKKFIDCTFGGGGYGKLATDPTAKFREMNPGVKVYDFQT